MPDPQAALHRRAMVDVPTLTAALKARTGLPDAQVKRLVDLYGSRAFHVWQLAEQDPGCARSSTRPA